MREVLRAACAAGEWPPSGPLMYMSGRQKCKHCEKRFSNLWVTNASCFECETRKRDAGECPVSARGKCPKRAFCPHEKKCIACERASCEVCGITCGDGDDVASLIESTRARCVFLDFDRTLCSTKTGASPLHGRGHSLDADLAGVAASHPSVHVVTRNSHVEDIRAFLTREGVPRGVRVHNVGRGVSKGRVIREIIDAFEKEKERGDSGSGGDCDCGLAIADCGGDRGGDCGERRYVFADDSVVELLDADVASVEGLVRVLFSRALA